MPSDIYALTLSICDEKGANVAYTSVAGSISIPQGVTDIWAYSSTDCFIRIGSGLVATVKSFPLPANIPIRLIVPDSNNSNNQVSAMQNNTPGILYIGIFA
jgi:hypothetical protein